MSTDDCILIGVDEAARRLSTSRSGVYALVRRGLLRPVYLDRRPRFSVADLLALVEQARGEDGAS
jgi:excisionase family DNA binding protein